MVRAKVKKREKDTLYYLLKFRFLTTVHIQQILGHKNPTYIQTLLKNLLDLGYVKRHYSKKNNNGNATPSIYYLAPLAKQILKDSDNWTESTLERIYKESTRSDVFMEHCLTIANIYLFFLSSKAKSEDLHFFTKMELISFDYFPKNLPDVYIALESKQKTKRYFLDLFDPYTPPRFIRRKVREYLSYQEDSSWQEGTGDNNPPTILLVLPTENIKKTCLPLCKGKT